MPGAALDARLQARCRKGPGEHRPALLMGPNGVRGSLVGPNFGVSCALTGHKRSCGVGKLHVCWYRLRTGLERGCAVERAGGLGSLRAI